MKFLKTATLSLLLLLLFSTATIAETDVYYSQADFLAAAAGMNIQVEGFDAYDAPTVVPNGVHFDDFILNYNTAGFDVQVDNLFDTTSPDNYLGTIDESAFYGGDSLTFSFSEQKQGFGIYIIAGFETEIFESDFMLVTNNGQSATNIDIPDPDVSLFDGNAYFLGFIEGDPTQSFNQVLFSSVSDDYYFNVDDVVTVVPELETWLMMLGGVPLMLWWQRRRFG